MTTEQNVSTQEPCGQLDQASLSAYLDQELTQQQNQQVEQHLKHCSSCQQRFQQFQQLSQGLQQESQRFQPFELNVVVQQTASANHWLIKLTWLLLAVGGLPLMVYGLYLHWQSTAELNWWLRGAMLSVMVGLLIGFIVVVRERVIARRTDKFNKVKL